VLALEHDGPKVYNIVDDEPAPVSEWLPVLADALGAKPPRRAPVWLARLFAGGPAVMLATEARGASNALAKRELGWSLRYPSWRQGFAAVYASSAARTAQPRSTAKLPRRLRQARDRFAHATRRVQPRRRRPGAKPGIRRCLAAAP
jgi:hypothetical protein